MNDRILYLIIFYPILLFSLSCHEAAHAWMANRFGDPTARYLGRVTLNPLPHLDLIGTVILPIFGILSGASLIGWGKPVPVNPMNLRNPRKDEIWIAAGGPLTNIAVAVLFAGVGRGLIYLSGYSSGAMDQIVGIIYTACYLGVRLNLGLAIFNLIPLYPLDGGGVLRGFLPDSLVDKFDHLSRQSTILLLILFATGALRFIFIPVQIVANILLPL